MKLLLYCTKAKPYLNDYRLMENCNQFVIMNKPYNNLNGKIVAECDFDVEEIRIVDDDPLGAYWYETKTLSENEVLKKSCLTSDEIFEYLGEDNEGYAIHIKNLHIFDEPKELSDYYGLIPKKVNTLNGSCYINESIEKAPQNMMYAIDDNDNEYVLISIKPQWLCKILNGEKTIEVRKKVLKGML